MSHNEVPREVRPRCSDVRDDEDGCPRPADVLCTAACDATLRREYAVRWWRSPRLRRRSPRLRRRSPRLRRRSPRLRRRSSRLWPRRRRCTGCMASRWSLWRLWTQQPCSRPRPRKLPATAVFDSPRWPAHPLSLQHDAAVGICKPGTVCRASHSRWDGYSLFDRQACNGSSLGAWWPLVLDQRPSITSSLQRLPNQPGSGKSRRLSVLVPDG